MMRTYIFALCIKMITNYNSGLCRHGKVTVMKSKGYRVTSKRKKIWSIQGNEKQARERESRGPRLMPVEIDPYIRIEVYRRHTGETAVFECGEGDRIDNYSVTCDGKYLGTMGVTNLMRIIGKALPSFRRMEE